MDSSRRKPWLSVAGGAQTENYNAGTGLAVDQSLPFGIVVTFSHAISVTGDEQTFFLANFKFPNCLKVTYPYSNFHNSDIRPDKR